MSAAAKISARLDGRTVLVVGRAGMDLYPLPDGSTIEAATGFVSDVGGSAGNIAVALARLGGKAALLSAFSDDAIGRFIMNSLENYSVDTAHCRILTGLERTSLAMAESRADAPSVVIYRNNAADLGITAEQVAAIDLEATGAIIITGTALSREPSRHACRLLTERADAAGCPVILDIDYRPQAWESSNEAADVLGDLAQRADMVVANDEEFDVVAAGEGQGLARSLADRGALVLYKMGRGGCDILDQGETTHVGIFEVTALKPFGAGDAFLGGVMSSLADGLDIAAAVRRGAAAAAMVVSRRGCASAMPDRAALNQFMAGNDTATEN